MDKYYIDNNKDIINILLSLTDSNGRQFFNKDWVLKKYGCKQRLDR